MPSLSVSAQVGENRAEEEVEEGVAEVAEGAIGTTIRRLRSSGRSKRNDVRIGNRRKRSNRKRERGGTNAGKMERNEKGVKRVREEGGQGRG